MSAPLLSVASFAFARMAGAASRPATPRRGSAARSGGACHPHALALLACLAVGLAVDAGAFDITFERTSDSGFGNPHDVKLSPDARHLYVADVDNDQVVVLDAWTLARVGTLGEGEQDGTHDVDFDADGRLLVADTHNDRVAIYALGGTAGTLAGELRGSFSWPEGVLAHRNGQIYVTGARSGNIVAFTQGRETGSAGGLSSPHDIEQAPNGDLWIADAGNDRLVRMSPDLRTVAVLDDARFRFSGPRYLDVLDDGTLIVADKYAHAIKVIAPDGRLLATLDHAGAADDRLRTPEGVEVHDDWLWIADSGNNRIVLFRLRR